MLLAGLFDCQSFKSILEEVALIQWGGKIPHVVGVLKTKSPTRVHGAGPDQFLSVRVTEFSLSRVCRVSRNWGTELLQF